MTAIDRAPLDDLVGSFAAEHHCPTISWGIVVDGRLAVSGAHDADGADGAVTDRTVYRIASMTKSMSAAATLMLRDEGVLSLDDPVGAYAPELGDLRGPTGDARPVTLRDMLSMSSGLVSDDPWADRHLDLTDDDLDRIIADGCVFAGSSGSVYEYSNFGYAVIGRVVHRASGQRIQDIVSERLIGPLGMGNTGWTRPDDGSWAPPRRWLDDRLADELPPSGDGAIAPMGGIWSDLRGMARWIAWFDDAFPARDGDDAGPLGRASRREMQTPQKYVGARLARGRRVPTCYGYGLFVLDEPDLGRVVTHSGGLPGYGSNMRWLPGRRLGLVALSNVTYAPMTDLTARLLDLLHEQGVVPSERGTLQPDVERTGRRLLDLLNRWEDAVADDLFADNVALDDSFGRRARAAAGFAPLTLTAIEPINDARARMHCIDAAGGAVTVTFALAPLRPIAIQDYEIRRR
jgi:CubicO group peptidase (beta-lactamase class C family)